MLSFSAMVHFLKKIKKTIPSPVRNSKTDIDCMLQIQLGKRASLPGSVKLQLAAGMSVEAAMVLPLFLFSGVILMTPIKLLGDQRRIQAALEQAAGDISLYAYIKEQMEEGNEAGSEAEKVMDIVGIGYVKEQVMKRVDRDRVSQVSFAKSRILENDFEIQLVVHYRQKLPFSVFGLESIPMEAVSVRRAWVGAEGGRLKNREKGGRDERDPVVYMGRNGTRYHLSPECHYLSNDLRALSLEQVERARNTEGERYKPCASCAGEGTEGRVYVMPSGSHYHTSQFCPSIVAYVRAVKKSEVEQLGVCSYCGGG